MKIFTAIIDENVRNHIKKYSEYYYFRTKLKPANTSAENTTNIVIAVLNMHLNFI